MFKKTSVWIFLSIAVLLELFSGCNNGTLEREKVHQSKMRLVRLCSQLRKEIADGRNESLKTIVSLTNTFSDVDLTTLGEANFTEGELIFLSNSVPASADDICLVYVFSAEERDTQLLALDRNAEVTELRLRLVDLIGWRSEVDRPSYTPIEKIERLKTIFFGR